MDFGIFCSAKLTENVTDMLIYITDISSAINDLKNNLYDFGTQQYGPYDDIN